MPAPAGIKRGGSSPISVGVTTTPAGAYVSRGLAWLGWAGQGKAGPGGAWRGKARQGMARPTKRRDEK